MAFIGHEIPEPLKIPLSIPRDGQCHYIAIEYETGRYRQRIDGKRWSKWQPVSKEK